MKNLKIKLVIVVGNLKTEKSSRGITNGSKCLKRVKHTEQGTWRRGHSSNCHIWQNRWLKYDEDMIRLYIIGDEL